MKRDWAQIRRDFPALAQEIEGQPLTYLDSAASSLMPQPVIDRLVAYHSLEHANVHRGVHTLSQRATDAYEEARRKVQRFLGAAREEECVFTSGSTEAINLVAQGWGGANLQEGDEIVLTIMEHHSNIVPWQVLRDRLGLELRVVKMDEQGVLDMEHYRSLLGSRTRLVSVVHVSNVLGTLNPVAEMIEAAHEVGAAVLVDGSQAAPHMPLDVEALGCDFYVVTGHKMNGPTGIGVLYGRMEQLERTGPLQTGGGMIDRVRFEATTFGEPPLRFEAGTPPIAAAIGLGAAIDYLQGIGMEAIHEREQQLLRYANERLTEIEGLRIIGQAPEKGGVLSFALGDLHPADVGTLLNSQGVAIRTGHHCAEPLMERLGVPATARASLSYYNDQSDIDRLVAGLHTCKDIFGA